MIGRIWRRLRGTRQSPERVALAVALGAFIGCLPVYGLHFVLCSLLCLPFGLDLLLCYLVANISNPLMAPFLVTLEVEVGSLVTTGHHAAFTLARAKQTGILGFVWQAGVGSVFVGAGLAAVGAGGAYWVARRVAGHGEPAVDEEQAFEATLLRTVERYCNAAIGDRIYVAAKLRSDPLTRLLLALPGNFGRVLDVGCGRGQFGLYLKDLGRCEALAGFDSDPRKIAVAVAAAGGDAHFETGDLLDLSAQRVDTVLLADVLHYLPFAEQDTVVERAAACVPHGRILIRELDAGSGPRGNVTRLLEWLAKVIGYNRGRAGRNYRPARELVAQLSAHGFGCEVQGASAGTPFANVLIVATRS